MRNPIIIAPYGNAEGWILTQQQACTLRLLAKAGVLTSPQKAIDVIGRAVQVLDIDDFLKDND